MSNKLKENQIIATQKVAMGLTNRQIAKELNVAEETICRWKQTPEFQAATSQSFNSLPGPPGSRNEQS